MSINAEFCGYIRVPFSYEAEEPEKEFESADNPDFERLSSLEYPKGWSFHEHYHTPIMSIAVMECDHLPDQKEIEKIELILEGELDL